MRDVIAVLLAIIAVAWFDVRAHSQEQPRVSLVDPIVHLPPGAKAGTGELKLRLEAANDHEKKISEPPTLMDLKLPDKLAAGVTLGKTVEVTSSGERNRTWRIDVIVEDLQPSNTVQARYADLGWDSKHWQVGYSISNQPFADVKLETIGFPAEWNVGKNDCISFRIVAASPSVTQVGFIANLSDEITKAHLGNEVFYLMDAGIDNAKQIPELKQSQLDAAASEGRPLQLCIDQHFEGYGKFGGTIVVFSAQRPEGKSITLTVYRTRLRWLGIVLILIGSAGAYVLKVYAPSVISRARELQPVIFLREQLSTIEGLLNGVPARTKLKILITVNEIGQWKTDLSDKSLDAKHYIHHVPPLPFGDVIDTSGYSTLLASASSKIATLNVVVQDGLVPASQREAGTPPKDLGLIDQAYRDIESYIGVVPPPSLEQLRQLLKDRLKKLDDDLANAMNIARAAHLPALTTSSGMSWEQVNVVIELWSATVWLIWTLLVAASGIVFLVYGNLAFGRPLDLLYCLLWGLGITATAQQFTSGLITTNLGVTLPKVGT